MKRFLSTLLSAVLLFSAPFAFSQTNQKKWELTWQDNSIDETGFRVEYANSPLGEWALVTDIINANVVSFSHFVNKVPAQQDCYRLYAFNDGGKSPYSNVACDFQPAPLLVAKTGPGTGTITSSPAGISCGATCTAEFAGRSTVVLTATVAPGTQFIGWTGACTGTGTCSVTMDAAKTVTASFVVPLPNAPTGLKMSNLTSTEARLAWSLANPELATGQKVHVESTQGPGSGRREWILVDRLATTYTDRVTRNTTYRYQVEAFSDAGGAFSNIVTAKTPNR